MTHAPSNDAGKPDPNPGSPPTEVSRPVGDAIPTPVEPGLDQPLPAKGQTVPDGEEADESVINPLGDTKTPPGVPGPSDSDFA